MHIGSAAQSLGASRRTSSGGRPCIRLHCQERSIRTPDLLSSASDHHVWTCAAGHQIADDDARTDTWPPRREEGVAIPREALEGPQPSPTDEEIMSAGRSIAQDADLDLIEFLQVLVETCTALVEADVGTVLLATSAGRLRSASSSVDDPGLADLFRATASEGPGLRSFTTGRSVHLADLRDGSGSSPSLSAAARPHGIRSHHATPLTVQGTPIGSLNLFFLRAGGLDPAAGRALRALTDDALAAAATAQLTRTVHDHLQEALDTRILIERATGVLMAMHDIGPAVARARITAHADLHRTTTIEVARAVLARTLDLPLEAHWTDLGSPRHALASPGVLAAASGLEDTAIAPPMDQEIIRLIEHAAAVQLAAGRKAAARRHRIAAASLRGTAAGALPTGSDGLGDR